MDSIKDLLGKTLIEVKQIDNDRIEFTTSLNEKWVMYHSQNCCESVSIEDINGDLADLIGNPITLAEESANSDDKPLFESTESWTWTFYKLATVKGYVNIRWYGSSNGYYSESVLFEKM
jgi:hypothetical protein